MPIYEYECPQHGKFEKLKRLPTDAMEPCPKCGKLCKKLMSVCSASFGWRLKDECHEIGGPRDEFEKDV